MRRGRAAMRLTLAPLLLATACSSAGTHGPAADAGREADATKEADARGIDAEARDAPARGDAADAPGGRDAPRGDGEAPKATTLWTEPLPLVPSFSQSIHDYYVRCAAGTNMVTVAMTAAPGSAIGLLQPMATPPSVEQTTTVGVTEGEAIVAGVTTDGSTDQYWIRCLPADFPLMAIVPHPDAGTPPTPGYYLMGDVVLAPGEGGYAMAVDTNGVPVWYHTTVTGQGAVDVDSLQPGVISFVPNLNDTYASVSGQFELLALAAGTSTSLESVGVPLDMHDLRLLPSGDYLVLADPIITGVNLTGLSTFGPEEDMVGCIIQELTPAGAKVWEWDVRDHFDAVEDSTWPQIYPVDGKTVVDPFHCNSIDVDANGDLLVSARHMDSVFMVSKATGAVLWKMGGAKYSKDDAAYVAVVGDPLTSFYRQHDARLLPDGTISMFDDQTETPGPARAVIYSYSLTAGTASVVWAYEGTRTSLAMGSFRILPDGSRVIGWGVGWGVGWGPLALPANRAFTEVDVNGNDLLDFAFPDGDDSYRAIKIPASTFDISLLRSSAGAN